MFLKKIVNYLTKKKKNKKIYIVLIRKYAFFIKEKNNFPTKNM